MHNYLLERRVKRLEQLIYEKTVTRGNDSRAYTIWKLLRDEGPLTRPEIRDRLGWTTPIIEMEQEGCVFKNGNRYSYNPDYNWEDVGVIPRTAQQELQQSLQQAIRSGNVEVDDEVTGTQDDSSTQQVTRTRAPRAPREPRQREITPNLFSRKFEEVKAAVDAGQNVNQTDDKGRTPLLWASMSNKPEAGQIIEYLLSHRANPNATDRKGTPAIFLAIKHKNIEAIKALAKRVNLGYRHLMEYPIVAAINNEVYDEDTLLSLIPTSLIEGIKSVSTDTSDNNQDIITNLSVSSNGFSNAYKEIIDRYISVYGKELYKVVTSQRLLTELFRGKTVLYDALNKAKSMIRLYDIPGGYSTNVLTQVHSYMLNAIKEKYEFADLQNFIHVANAIERSVPELKNGSIFNYMRITPEFILSLSNKDYVSFVEYYLKYFNINKIKEIIKCKYPIKGLYAGSLLSAIVTSNIPSNAMPTVLRLLNFAVNPSYYNIESASRIRRSDNEYLIDWAIDHGLGEALSKLEYASISTLCATKLAEAGYSTVRTDYTQSAKEKKVSEILSAIKKDVWDRGLEKYVNDHPEVLLDDRITDAIEDNSESVAAMQLKRKIDALPKDVYDF